MKKRIKKCFDCGISKRSIYNFKIVKCRKCKKYFCEGCLIDGVGCPNCSDIFYI